MSLSDRFSGRVVDGEGDHLVRGADQANEGADGNRPGTSPTRVGRRQLARLRSHLSDRDRAVLRSLAVLHYATTTQLERLHFHGTSATDLAAARAARRTLARLHELRVIHRLERRIGGVRAGSASYVLCLSPAGARLVSDSSRRRSREPSLAHLDHVLAVTELVVRLQEHARSGAVQQLAIETEPTCWRSIVGPHGSRLWLKPDLRVTVARGERELHWFVELDRGTEHRPALRRKLDAYVAAWRDGGEQARVGVFPRVLWVVPDGRRANVIARACDTSDVPAGMCIVAEADAAIGVLADDGGGR